MRSTKHIYKGSQQALLSTFSKLPQANKGLQARPKASLDKSPQPMKPTAKALVQQDGIELGHCKTSLTAMAQGRCCQSQTYPHAYTQATQAICSMWLARIPVSKQAKCIFGLSVDLSTHVPSCTSKSCGLSLIANAYADEALLD